MWAGFGLAMGDGCRCGEACGRRRRIEFGSRDMRLFHEAWVEDVILHLHPHALVKFVKGAMCAVYIVTSL